MQLIIHLSAQTFLGMAQPGMQCALLNPQIKSVWIPGDKKKKKSFILQFGFFLACVGNFWLCKTKEMELDFGALQHPCGCNSIQSGF